MYGEPDGIYAGRKRGSGPGRTSWKRHCVVQWKTFWVQGRYSRATSEFLIKSSYCHLVKNKVCPLVHWMTAIGKVVKSLEADSKSAWRYSWKNGKWIRFGRMLIRLHVIGQQKVDLKTDLLVIWGFESVRSSLVDLSARNWWKYFIKSHRTLGPHYLVVELEVPFVGLLA